MVFISFHKHTDRRRKFEKNQIDMYTSAFSSFPLILTKGSKREKTAAFLMTTAQSFDGASFEFAIRCLVAKGNARSPNDVIRPPTERKPLERSPTSSSLQPDESRWRAYRLEPRLVVLLPLDLSRPTSAPSNKRRRRRQQRPLIRLLSP